MKNEALIRAISGIDDQLILDAHSQAPRKRRGKKYFGLCAAACLVLICGLLFFPRSGGGLEIHLNGNPVSSWPAAVDLPAPLSSGTRQTDDPWLVITVPFEIVSEGDLSIQALDGTIEIYASKTNQRIGAGQLCKTKGPVAVQWSIDNPNDHESYRVYINKTALILNYEQKTNQWTITKQED